MELLGLIAFVLLSGSFYITRSRMAVYNILSATVLATFVWTVKKLVVTVQVSEEILLFAGLVFYWFGLLSIRTMLNRSVSLSLLKSYADGDATQQIQNEIRNRFNDLKHYRLAEGKDGEYKLTWLGRLIGAMVRTGYFIFRIK